MILAVWQMRFYSEKLKKDSGIGLNYPRGLESNIMKTANMGTNAEYDYDGYLWDGKPKTCSWYA